MKNTILKFLFRRIPVVDIYTDGSAKEGRGAWAFVIVRDGVSVREKSAGVKKASSNPMEFRAAIEALKSFEEKTTATLYSDSRILIDSMTVWQGTDLRPRSLEAELAELDHLAANHVITWKWIKAHAGHKFNERCDQLCIQARDRNPQ
jgi:ribonuclease HI